MLIRLVSVLAALSPHFVQAAAVCGVDGASTIPEKIADCQVRNPSTCRNSIDGADCSTVVVSRVLFIHPECGDMDAEPETIEVDAVWRLVSQQPIGDRLWWNVNTGELWAHVRGPYRGSWNEAKDWCIYEARDFFGLPENRGHVFGLPSLEEALIAAIGAADSIFPRVGEFWTRSVSEVEEIWLVRQVRERPQHYLKGSFEIQGGRGLVDTLCRKSYYSGSAPERPLWESPSREEGPRRPALVCVAGYHGG